MDATLRNLERTALGCPCEEHHQQLAEARRKLSPQDPPTFLAEEVRHITSTAYLAGANLVMWAHETLSGFARKRMQSEKPPRNVEDICNGRVAVAPAKRQRAQRTHRAIWSLRAWRGTYDAPAMKRHLLRLIRIQQTAPRES